MATDTTNISTETTANNALQEGDVEQGHVTQSNAPVPVQVPAGQNIVRIQVTPGETIQLPFPTDGLVAKLSPDNANLAVKVGDITVILLGYSEANANGDVTLLGSDGQSVDVATVLANTDPNLDIATAAGPGAGDQGTGADNNGGVFAPFDPNAGIGGLNAIGGLDPTALNYGLLQREFPELEENDEVDTVPTLINIRQGAVINEDDLAGIGDEKSLKSAPDQDPAYQSQISSELAQALGIVGGHVGRAEEDGNDPFDLDDHDLDNNPDNDNDPNTPPPGDDNGQGVDTDREPLTSTAVITVDFHQDVPGKITFQNGADIPLQTQLEAMGLTSHGHELQYKLLPAVADDPNTPGDESHGEVLVAYYVQPEWQWVQNPEGEGGDYQLVDTATIVFSIGVREQQGDTNVTEFHLDFTIYAPIDNVPGPVDADGSLLDSLDINVPFFMVDSDGSVTPSPAEGVTFHSVDDVPFLGETGWEFIEGPTGESGQSGPTGHWEQVIEHTDTTLIHDETAGVQYGGKYAGPDGDVDPSEQSENDVYPQWYQGSIGAALGAAHLDSDRPIIGAALKELTVSFGADGRAGEWQEVEEGNWQFVGNKEAGKTVFTGDDDGTFATAFQLYIGQPNTETPLTAGATNWTVMIDGVEVVVRAVQVDANTILGFANINDKDGDGVVDGNADGGDQGTVVNRVAESSDVPVFVLRIDPSNGELILVQLHQINHDNPDDSDQTSPDLTIGGEPVTFRGTDFDGDHVDAELHVAVQDDGPTVTVTTLEVPHSLTLDETTRQGGDGVSSVTVNFGDNFNAANFNFGTDGEHVGQNGADGISYTLSLNGESVGSGLYALDNTDATDGDGDGIGQGAEIMLSQLDAHTVIGSVNGTEYFRITTADNGDVTFSQSNNIWHANTGDHDDSQGLKLADGTLKLVLTLTDGDGDHAAGSLDIGNGVFAIEDDGPVASVDEELRVDTLTLDESRLPNSGDGVRSVSADFGDNFKAGSLDFGSDGAGSVAYALTLSGSGIGSGLYALDNTDKSDADGDGIGQGSEILLSKDGADVVGSVNGVEYFRISVDGDGKVTFSQSNNIWHGDTTSHDDTQYLVTESAGDLKIVQTLTDADGDTSSASIDLGDDIFRIEDDGPKAVVKPGQVADVLLVDESPLPNNGDGIKSATANFADNFNSAAGFDYGTDGPGKVSYALNLSANGIGSGLYALDPSDTIDGSDGIGQGSQILLSKVGNDIIGAVNGITYFTITVDADGKVTFTQVNNIWHENTNNHDDTETLTLSGNTWLKIEQTLVDADGDSSKASIDLGTGVFKIQDDGPDAKVKQGQTPDILVLDETRPLGTDTDGTAPNGVASVSADFSDNFNKQNGTFDYGTDGPGKVEYNLQISNNGIGSGLYALDPSDTVDGSDGIGQGSEIQLYKLGNGDIVGRVGNTEYFRISVDGSGVVTFSQSNNIWHPNTSNDDDSQTLTVDGGKYLKLVQTLTDADGDTDSAEIQLGSGVFKIQDDGPDAKVAAEQRPDILTLDESPLPNNGDGIRTTTADFSDNFNKQNGTFDFGSDGPGKVEYDLTISNNGMGSGLYALDANDKSANDGDGIGQGSEIQLFKLSNGDVVGRVGNTEYFRISVDGNGNVTFSQSNNIWHANTGSDDDTSILTVDQGKYLKIVQTLTDADGDSDSASIDLGTGVFKIQDDGPDAKVKQGQTPDIITLDESPLPSNGDGVRTASASFADNFNQQNGTFDFGTDGPGKAEYALSLLQNGLGSGLYALDANDKSAADGDGIGQGSQIVLNKVGNDILGQVGNVTYFTITVDGSGNVTFTQLKNIWHNDTGNDDDTSTLNTATGNLKITQTLTDADGDSDSASIDLSAGVFKIQDDGPDAVVKNGQTPDVLTVDESPLPNNGDGIASATASFADNFNQQNGTFDYGTDGAGSVAYALLLSANGTASGLYALDANDKSAVDGDGIGQGQQIVLNKVGNDILGQVGNVTYFTITVDGSGNVTFTQLKNVWHSDTGSDDDTSTLNAATNALRIQQTLVDADGDSDTAVIDLSKGVFKIQDDGPNAVVKQGQTPDVLTLDESAIAKDGIKTTTADFSDNFNKQNNTFDYGTDGPGGVAYALSLTGSNVASGLYALDANDKATNDGDGLGQGAQIVLNKVGNDIVGTAGATEYFRISVDGNGIVTFTQSNNIWHANTGNPDDSQTLTLSNANLLKIVQTLTDADGDTSQAAINLGTGVFKIEDDGPTAVVKDGQVPDVLKLDESSVAKDGIPSTTADFSDNFNKVNNTFNFGTDGPGSVAYALSLTGTNVASGLYALDANDKSAVDGDGIGQGTQIVLNKVGNDVVGSVGGTEYFRISVDNNGIVTFTQSKNIWHADTGNHDDAQTLTLSNANLLKIVQTLTDADGDSSEAAINLGTGVFKIEDDGPTAVVSNATADKLTLDESLAPSAGDGISSAVADFADNFNSAAGFNYGTDGKGSVGYTLDLVSNGTASGLYALDPSDTSTADGDGYGKGAQIVLNKVGDQVLGQVGGVTYFTISVDADGKVTFSQQKNIWHSDVSNADEPASLSTTNAGDLKITQKLTDADGDTSSASINLGQNVFSIQDDGPSLTINTGPSVGALSVVEDSEAPGSAALAITAPSIVTGGTDGTTTQIGYTLALLSAASGLQTTIGNHPITLIQVSPGVIEGQFDSDNNPNTPNAVAFRVEITGTAVKLTSFEALEHDNNQGPNPAEVNTLNLDGKINLVATVTVTDGDGDQVAGTKSSASSLSLTFTDTDPTLKITVAPAIAALSVIEDSEVGGSKSVAITPPQYTASAVDGIDHVTITYGFNLLGTATGLVTTEGNHAITLFKVNDGLIEGRYDDNGTKVAFTVTITGAPGSEQVTLTSNVALEHSNTPQGGGEDNTLDLNGLINITANVTAYDGDNDAIAGPASTSSTLSLTFEDTDPTLTINTAPSVGALTVVEHSDAGGSQSLSITAPSITANAVDGVTTSTNYTLALNAGAASGLMTTIGNFPITLIVSPDGKTIAGIYNDGGLKTAFTVEVTGAPGAEKVTLTSFVALEHDNNQGAGESNTLDLNGKINLVATVTATDGDNDSVVSSKSSAASLSLAFQDTDPTLTIDTGPTVGAMSVVEDSLVYSSAIITAPTYTANAVDGFTTTVGYALSIIGGSATGIFTTSGHEVFLVMDGINISGRFDSDGNNSLDGLAFTLAIGPSGGNLVLALASYEALEHPNNPQGSGEVNFLDFGAKIGLTATVTVTDGDGDVIAKTASNPTPISAQITDTDPTLTINTGATLPALNVVEAGPGNTATVPINPPTITASAVDGYTTSFDYKLALGNGAASGLVTTDGNHPITLEVSPDGKTVSGKFDSDGNGSLDSTAFTLVVSGSQVTLTSNVALEHDNNQGPNPVEDNTLDLAGKVQLVTTVTVTDGDNDSVVDSKTSTSSLDVNFYDTDPTLTINTAPSVDAIAVVEDSDVAGSKSFTITAPEFTANAIDGVTTSTNYTLALANGGASGLMTTIGNHPITLIVSPDGKTVAGIYNDGGLKTAFTVEVTGAAGAEKVTLTSFEALEHDNNQGQFEQNFLTLNGKINLVATVTATDGDNDSVVASKTSATTLALSFEDTDPTLTLHTGPIVGPMSAVEASGIANHSVAFITPPTFTATAVDGYTTKIDYALSIIGGSATGIFTTSGHEVFMIMVGENIVGAFDSDGVGGIDTPAFFVEFGTGFGYVDPAALVFTSMVALEHPNSPQGSGEVNFIDFGSKIGLTTTITVTDGDGDVIAKNISNPLPITAEITDTDPTLTVNTGPSITPIFVVEDSDVAGKSSATITAPTFTPSAVDGIASTNVAYALGLPNGTATGLVTTDGNHAITLVKVSDTVVEGRFDDDNNAGTPDVVAFKVELSGTTVTLTSYVALEHDNNQGPGESNTLSLANLVNVTASITALDGDGDPLAAPVTTSASIGLNFTDTNPNAENDGTLTMTGLGTQAGAASLLANDLPVAVDGAAITSVKFGATDYALVGGTVDIPVTGGTLTVKSDGSWSFNQTSYVGSATTHNFTYTLTDGDGDTDTATFAVALKVSNNPTFSVDTAKVDEDGLVDQTNIPAGPGDDNQNAGDSGAGLLDPDGAGPRNSESVWQQQINVNWGGPASGTIALTANQPYLQLTDGTPIRPQGGLGEFLFLVSSDGGHTLTAYRSSEMSGGQPLPGASPYLTITVTDTGLLTVNLLKPVQHPGHDDPATPATTETSYEDNFNISLTMTATNENGQSTQHSFNVNVDDDSPIAFDDTDAVTEGFGNQISGNVITGAGNDGDPAGADYIGADNGFYAVGFPRTGAEGQPGTAGNLATPLQGTYGTLTLNPDGSYIYKLTTASVPLGAKDYFNYALIDADGDKDVATLTITINQDTNVPLVGSSTVTVDEEGLPSRPGESAGTQEAGSSEVAFGSFTISTPEALGALTIGGVPVNLGGGFPQTLIDTPQGTLIINSIVAVVGGYQVNYIYGLKDNDLTHSTQGKDDTVDGPTFTVYATDVTGDTNVAAGSIKIVISDDAPIAVNDGLLATLDDNAAGVNIGNISTLLSNDKFGADSAALTNYFTVGTGSLGGTIVVDPSGNLVYTSHHNTFPGDADTETFTYTIKDGDGDTATATFTVKLIDTKPTLGTPVNTLLDEEGLELGNWGDSYPGGTDVAGQAVSASNQALNVNYGNDTPGTLEFNTVQAGLAGLKTSDGTPVNFTILPSGQLVGYTGVTVPTTTFGPSVVFFATLNASGTGSYSFSLLQALQHSVADAEDNVSLPISFIAKDAEGEATTGSFTVTVNDDAPLATADTGSVTEGGQLTVGAGGGVLFNDKAGVDGYAAGGGVIGVRAASGDTTTPVVTGVNTVINGQYGTLTLQADGSYVYKSNPNSISSNVVDTFVYTIKDKDGDTATTTLKINVADATIVVNPAEATVDEAALDTFKTDSDLGAGTVTGSNPSLTTETVTGTLTLPAGVSVTPQTNVATPLGLFSIDSTGHYTYTLTKNSLAHTSDLPNTNPNATNPDAVVDTITVAVSDGNGNSSSTTITIHVKDDVPSIVANGTEPTATVDETALGVSAVGFFANAFGNTNFGADGVGSLWNYTLSIKSSGVASGLTDTATGQPIVLVMNNGVVEGHVSTTGGLLAFTASINSSNGDVTLTQLRAVVHTDASNPDDARTLAADDLVTVTVTIVDGDGDSASASLNIGQNLIFKDDGPSISATAAADALQVDETNLATDAAANFADNFTSAFGADGAGTLTYALSSITGFSTLFDTLSGQAVMLSTTAGGVVEGRTQFGGDLVFTVTVNGSGVVVLDQIRAVTHADTSNPDDVRTLTSNNLIVLTATITDKDNDSKSASIDLSPAISFKDDGPTISVKNVTEPVLTVDETTLANDATQSFAGNFTSLYGADGAGTLTYALSIKSANVASGLVDTATNEAIKLVMNGTTVEGRTVTSNELVFTVKVNSAGDVTLDQIRAIVHPTTNPDEPKTLATDDLVKLTATITDKEGDAATATMDIGQNLVFKDDGPSIALSANTQSLTVDETILTTNDTKSYAGLFTTSYGADGAGTTTYALGIKSANVASGLVDTLTGEAVNLVMNGTTVEGRTASTNALVFTVTVDGSGNVTLDQIRAIVHPTTNPDEAKTLSAADLITLKATITDKDTDTANVTANIGQTLNFKDDGPSITLSASTQSLTVDETALTTDDTKSYAGLFTTNYGADGAGTTAYALGIKAANVASGLVDTATNEAIKLVMNGTTVEGRTVTTNALVFTVTVDGSGNVTLDQIRAIVHPTTNPDESKTLSAADLITLTATITDKDNDTANVTANIGQTFNFKDDGPSISLSANTQSLTVDETTLATNDTKSYAGLFTSSYGNDGAGTTVYALGIKSANVASGLTDTLTNEAIKLVMNGTTVEGRTVTTNALVFTVTVDGSGNVTLDQIRAIVHPTTNPDESKTLSAADLITLTATITDKDNDTANVTANIGQTLNFKDDGPSITLSAGTQSLTVDETTLATNDTKSYAGLFTTSYGADGAGTTAYALGIKSANVASGLVDTATNEAIKLVMNGTTVEGRTVTTNALVFTVTVDGSGNVTLDQIRAIVHPSTNPDESKTLSAADLITLTATITDKDNDTANVTANIGQTLNFKDDGPSISLSANTQSLTVDETALATNDTKSYAGLFTSSYGADGAGTTAYALGIKSANVASGLTDTLTNEAIKLVMNGTTVEGRTVTTNALVFTVTVDGSGNVTLDQIRAIVHPTTNPDESKTLSAADLITLTATITDKDNDTANVTANIGQTLNFKDDGPSISLSAGTQSLTVDETTLTTDDTKSYAGLFTSSYGADGAGTTAYALGIKSANVASGLTDTLTNEAIKLVMNGTTVEGRTVTTNALVFTVTVDGSGNVTLDQIRAIVHPTTNPDESKTLSAADLITLTATITDKDNDTANVTANIGQTFNFKDDGPTANNDVDSVIDGGKATGNVLTGVDIAVNPDTNTTDGVADNAGADGGAVVTAIRTGQEAGSGTAGTLGVALAGTYGTLTINADGSYTYQANKNISNASDVTDYFTYTMKDKDGDTDTAQITITVKDGKDPTFTGPNAAGFTLTVEESDLSFGTTPAGTDEVNSNSATITAGDDNVVSIKFSNDISGLLTNVDGVAGADVAWTRVSDTQIVGKIGGLTAITLDLTAPASIAAGSTGNATVTATLSDNFPHPAGNGAQTISIGGVNIVATDIDGDTASALVSVSVKDDIPTAAAVNAETASVDVLNTNLMLILDISGSMGDASGLTSLDRLAAAKAAINELFEQYNSLGDVMVRLVTFSTSAAESGSVWTTLAVAKATIDGLTDGGNTNYFAAITAAMGAFGDSGRLGDGTNGTVVPSNGAPIQNVSYFMSDGVPNPSNTTITSGTREADWITFLKDNDIKSYAIGAGDAFDTTTTNELKPIAYDGKAESNDDANLVITLDDYTKLAQSLTSTLPVISNSIILPGNGNSFGADGGFVKSLAFANGTTITYNATNNTVSSSGPALTNSYNGTTHNLTVTLVGQGILVMNVLTGVYTFTADAALATNTTIPVTFTLSDFDGDTASAVLSLGVDPINLAPIARDDTVLVASGAVTLDSSWLTWNDSDRENGVISITTAAITTSNNGDGSSSYTLTDDHGNTDTAAVTWTHDNSSTLSGNGLDNIIVGDNSNETINGYEGNDVLVGGAGNDVIHGNEGRDLLIGGSGNDQLFGDDGNDTLVYDANDKFDGGAGFDRVLIVGSGQTAAYDAVGSNATHTSVEMLDLGDASNRSGAGNTNTVTINAADVLDTANVATIGGHQVDLIVIGDNVGGANNVDKVDLTGFTMVPLATNQAYTDAITGTSHNYDIYVSSTNANVKIAVEHDLNVF